MSITTRSIDTLIKNQGIGDLYRIYSICQRDGIDFNLASIPPDFREVRKGPFDAVYMNALFDRGYALARHNYSWVKALPEIEIGHPGEQLSRPFGRADFGNLGKFLLVKGRPGADIGTAVRRRCL